MIIPFFLVTPNAETKCSVSAIKSSSRRRASAFSSSLLEGLEVSKLESCKLYSVSLFATAFMDVKDGDVG